MTEARSIMNDFNRKVEDASARVSKTVADAAERIEREIPEFIKYLNDEVVPAVRSHSTKALRVASQKLNEFADYMDRQSTEQHPRK
jgi:glutamyl-tRNA reductase